MRGGLIALLFAFSVVGGGSCDRAASDSGPLVANDPASSYGAGFFVDVNAPYTFSDVLLGNSGEEPITIDSVALINPRGLEIVGTRIGTLTTRDYPSGADGFPPVSYHFEMQPIGAAPIPPKGAFDQPHVLLIVGMSAAGAGISSATGFLLGYHTSSGGEYTATIRYAVAFCAPRSHWERKPFRTKCVAPAAASMPST